MNKQEVKLLPRIAAWLAVVSLYLVAVWSTPSFEKWIIATFFYSVAVYTFLFQSEART